MRDLKRALYADDPLDLLVLVSAVVEVATAPDNPLEQPKERPTLAQLVDSFVGVDIAATTGALHVMAALTTDEVQQQRIRDELAQRTQPMPEWLRDLEKTQVSRVIELKDVAFRDGENYLIGIELPGGSELTFIAYVDNNLGGVLKDGFVAPDGLDEVAFKYREIQDEPDMQFGHVDPAWARAWIEQAVTRGANTVPPLTSESWPQARPLLRWVLSKLPEGGTLSGEEAWPESRVEKMVEDLLGSPEWQRYDHDPDHREMLDALIWLGTSYGHCDPLRWSPVRVEMLLADWFPRKVVADVEQLEKMPRALEGLIRYGHRVSGIRPERTAETMAALRSWESVFLDAIADDDDDWFLDAGPMPEEVVGGRAAYEAMTDEPLPDEPFDWTGIRDDVRPKIEEILALCDSSADELLDVEHRTANRRLLRKIALADPDYFLGRAAARTSAAAIAWMIGHANDTFDLMDPTATELLEMFGVRSASQRAGVFRKRLGLPQHTPADGPMVLGDADLLVSARRAELLRLRDAIHQVEEIFGPPR